MALLAVLVLAFFAGGSGDREAPRLALEPLFAGPKAPEGAQASLAQAESVLRPAGNVSHTSRGLLTAAAGSHPPGSQPMRRVYIDMGANWANTLRLYGDVGGRRSEAPWEVYAFEASPFISPYLEAFVQYLNGQRDRPEVTVPPTGSTLHLSKMAERFGCGPPKGGEEMRQCMFNTFEQQLAALQPDLSLQTPSLIAERLSQAAHPAIANRFVHVPAAVGAEDGFLELSKMTPQQMIRGGAWDVSTEGSPTMTVPKVDVVSWIQNHFHEQDYIVLKMDVEGAEFPILEALMKRRPCLIDVLAYECHKWGGNCEDLSKSLSEHSCIQVVTQPEWDRFSGPDVYYPADPRKF